VLDHPAGLSPKSPAVTEFFNGIGRTETPIRTAETDHEVGCLPHG
jgi:hypothetical protein